MQRIVSGPMARALHRRRPSRRQQLGGTFLGVLIGLVAGLVIAAIAAFIIYRAPLPFIAGQPASDSDPVEVELVPETPVPAGSETAAAILPDPNRSSSRQRVMPQVDRNSGLSADEVATVDVTNEETGQKETIPLSPVADPAVVTGRFMVQAGSFRNPTDAEALKLRLALSGLEAMVMSAKVNGRTVHRVRLGPYDSLDEVDEVRNQLAEEGIEVAVIRSRGR